MVTSGLQRGFSTIAFSIGSLLHRGDFIRYEEGAGLAAFGSPVVSGLGVDPPSRVPVGAYVRNGPTQRHTMMAVCNPLLYYLDSETDEGTIDDICKMWSHLTDLFVVRHLSFCLLTISLTSELFTSMLEERASRHKGNIPNRCAVGIKPDELGRLCQGRAPDKIGRTVSPIVHVGHEQLYEKQENIVTDCVGIAAGAPSHSGGVS
ncbi:hypothetical protein CIB48_g4394 [Xylaria polymorpha]|nr:hypothetical protein CIB48_g4394 [Xylaria polymorpha]